MKNKVMKRGFVALCMLLVLGMPQVFSQKKTYGEASQRQIVANYKGEWKPVVGAKGNRPVVYLGDGKTKSVSLNTKLSFPQKGKVLPIAGEVKLLEKRTVRAYPYPDHHIKSTTLKFIPKEDFDNLYLVLIFSTKDSKITGIKVKEIGEVKAGKNHKVSYEYMYFYQRDKMPDVRFYSKGLEVRVNKANFDNK